MLTSSHPAKRHFRCHFPVTVRRILAAPTSRPQYWRVTHLTGARTMRPLLRYVVAALAIASAGCYRTGVPREGGPRRSANTITGEEISATQGIVSVFRRFCRLVFFEAILIGTTSWLSQPDVAAGLGCL